jgi:N-acetyl-1-D-myo-inositol-2-amino-2-deoxy-alpha-D-glucopyranoside deacetylase
MTGGLMVIVAHPDDEVLIAGGTLAACAAAALPTAVLCLTRGEQGPIADPAVVSRSQLPTVRIAELRASCAALGVDWVKCYRRQDGYLRWSDAGAIVRQIEAVLRTHQPAAVITFGEDGLYYHPDHIATYDYALRAVQRLADPPHLYRAVWPENLMVELTAELAGRGLPSDLWTMTPESFGVEDEDRLNEIALDVRAQIGRKLSALRCHRSQFGPSHAFSAIPDELAEKYFGVERFVCVTSPSDDGWLERAVGRASVGA